MYLTRSEYLRRADVEAWLGRRIEDPDFERAMASATFAAVDAPHMRLITEVAAYAFLRRLSEEWREVDLLWLDTIGGE